MPPPTLPSLSGLLRRALVQSALANLRARGPLPGDVVAETWHLPLRGDDDRLVADAYWRPMPAPALLVLHGVGGSSTSGYVLRAVHAGLAAGLHVVALNLRGVGRGAAVARKLYHAGLVGDVYDALAAIAKRAQVTSTLLLGFSLGGQLALKFAAHAGDAAPLRLRAVATVSAPFDLRGACRRLDAMPAWPYRRHILAGLVRHCERLAQHAPLPTPLHAIARLRTLEAFDDAVTAPMHGFADARDYYRRVACGPDLSRVRLPALCIHAADDPVVPLETLREAWARAASAVECLWTPHGGHVGFVTELRRLRSSWAVAACLSFLRAAAPGGEQKPPLRR